MENDVRSKEISEETKKLVEVVDVDKIADEYLSKKADQEAAVRAFWEYVWSNKESDGETNDGEVKDWLSNGKEAFRKVAKSVIKELGVHGVVREKPNGEKELLPFTDADGKCALGLFRMAGIEAKSIYVKPGEFVVGKINVDTGNRDVSLENGTLFIDHHARTSSPDSSATERVYDILVRTGLLEPTMALEGLVDFVTGMDNANFEGMYDKDIFLNSDKNMVGLFRFLSFEELYSYFYDLSNEPLRPMKEKLLKKWPVGEGVTKLVKHSIKIRESIDKSVVGMEELEKKGMIFESSKYGKVMVDIGFTMPLGRPCAFAHGYDTFVSWSPEQNSFMVSSRQPLEVDYVDGFTVRGLMWLKPRGGERLRVGLGDVVEQLEVDEKGLGEGLRDYLKMEGSKKVESSQQDDREKRVGHIRDKVRRVRLEHTKAHLDYQRAVRKRQMKKIEEIRGKQN